MSCIPACSDVYSIQRYVTCSRSVVFSGNSGLIHHLNWLVWWNACIHALKEIVNVIVDLRFMIGLVKLSSAHKILTELSLSYTLYVLVDLSITYKKLHISTISMKVHLTYSNYYCQTLCLLKIQNGQNSTALFIIRQHWLMMCSYGYI